MSRRTISLDVVRVKSPCGEDWDRMTGDDRVRFCAGCGLHVHNLSAMPRDEAERLLCDSAGRLCVRYVPAEGGGVRTLEYAPRVTRRTYLFWSMLGAVGAAIVAAAQLFTPGAVPAPPAPAPVVGDTAGVMGEVEMVMGAMVPVEDIPASSTDGNAQG